MLVRSPAVLQEDPAFKQYLDNGHARLIQGDAMSESSVISAWNDASSHAPVDVVLYSLGIVQTSLPYLTLTDTVTFKGPAAKFNLFKGFVIDKPNVSTMAFLYTMRAMAQQTTLSSTPLPRLIVVSAKSVTPGSLAANPAPVRLIVGWLLRQPNLDKRGMEAIAFHGLGKKYEEGMTPGEPILPVGWKESLPAAGWAKRAVIVRPPQLTDNPAKGKYRADTKDFSVRKISRRDLGAFLSGDLLEKWDQFEGEVVTIGY